MARIRKTEEEIRKEEAQRKEFANKIKSLSSYEAKYSDYYEYNHVQEDGKAYINVDLNKVESPFSPYSYDTRIAPEIYEYIENEAYYLRADIPLVVNFDDGGRFSDEIKFNVASQVVRHYRLKYEEARAEHQRNNVFAYISLGIGATLLLIYFLLNIFLGDVVVNSVVFEMFEIVSWVFIWECVDRLFISGTRSRVDVFNAGQLALIEITFGEPVYKK